MTEIERLTAERDQARTTLTQVEGERDVARGWSALWHKKARGYRMWLRLVKATNVALTDLAADGYVVRQEREAHTASMRTLIAARDVALRDLAAVREGLTAALEVLERVGCQNAMCDGPTGTNYYTTCYVCDQIGQARSLLTKEGT